MVTSASSSTPKRCHKERENQVLHSGFENYVGNHEERLNPRTAEVYIMGFEEEQPWEQFSTPAAMTSEQAGQLSKKQFVEPTVLIRNVLETTRNFLVVTADTSSTLPAPFSPPPRR